jgi:hypothetical protein
VDERRLGLAGEDARVGPLALIATASRISHWNPPLREVEGRAVFEIFCNLVGEQFYDSIRAVEPLSSWRGRAARC